MNGVPHDRGLELLVAHCASLDPDSATARERLDEVIGPELARMLVFALSAGGDDRDRPRALLRARPVFAA
jgi:hypothetical protein